MPVFDRACRHALGDDAQRLPLEEVPALTAFAPAVMWGRATINGRRQFGKLVHGLRPKVRLTTYAPRVAYRPHSPGAVTTACPTLTSQICLRSTSDRQCTSLRRRLCHAGLSDRRTELARLR